MLLYGVPLIFSLASLVYSADIPKALDCSDLSKENGNLEACYEPIGDVVAVVPGSSYVAKLECKDCPYLKEEGRRSQDAEDGISKGDVVFLLNVTLAHNKRTLLLNDRPIYPLPTIPLPPRFSLTQYPTTLSNTNLTAGLTCPNPFCEGNRQGADDYDCVDWCWRLPLTTPININYLYMKRPTNYEGDKDKDTKYWEVALDVIGRPYGGSIIPGWKFDSTEQKMLWVLVKGTPVKTQKHKSGTVAADPFGSSGNDDKVYEYHIVDVRLQARAYTFPAKKPLSLWGRIGHFFGNDIWSRDGNRFLYISSEWGNYGKKGTLRDIFGEFVHWQSWDLFWLILSSTVSGLFALFGFWKLFWWIVQQRELMKWDGIDDVWENIRRERIAEEEGALLNEGGYRDDPEDGEGSSRPPPYTDDTKTMKPLPSKPLPPLPDVQKPLPEVPLIDA